MFKNFDITEPANVMIALLLLGGLILSWMVVYRTMVDSKLELEKIKLQQMIYQHDYNK